MGTLSLLALFLAATAAATAPPGADRTRLRTGGFDYDANAARKPGEAAWLARHHDLVVGVQTHGAGRAFDATDPRILAALRQANPRVQVLAYVPFQTVMPWMRAFLEDWARDRKRDPEDLYCHYAVDTVVKLRDGREVRVGGYPDGSAKDRAASRVPSTWWKGEHPNVCPWSPLFREGFAALVQRALAVPGAAPLDGVLLDSFSGTLDKPWDLRLENVVEFRALGAKDAESARQVGRDGLASFVPALGRALREGLGRPAVVMPNAGDIDDVYHWHKDLYAERFRDGYTDFAVEYLITPGHARTARIPRLKAAYEDMTRPEGAVRFFFTSHTTTKEPAPHGFEQMMLAAHYLLQNENGTFAFHRGGAGWYGAAGGRFANSHWHPNLDVDLGAPVVRAQPDAWNAPNTDRFFVLEQTPDHTVLARLFERGMVVAKFGREAGIANIGTRLAPVRLGGSYRRLLADNGLAPAAPTVDLGWGEGALLLRSP